MTVQNEQLFEKEKKAAEKNLKTIKLVLFK